MAGKAEETVEEFSLDGRVAFSCRPCRADRGPGRDDVAIVAESGRGDGVEGWIDDDMAFAKSWRFDLTTIEVAVGMWRGRQDRMVPFALGEWLHSKIKTSRSSAGVWWT